MRLSAVPRHTALRLVAGLAAAVLPDASATAADWSLAANISQRFEADTNRGLDPDPAASFGSTTSLRLNLGLQTQRTNWNLSTTLRGRAFVGGNDDDLSGFRPDLSGAVHHDGGRFTIDGNINYMRDSTNFTRFFDDFPIDDGMPGDPPVGGGDVIDPERTRADTIETRMRLGANWAYLLDSTNTLSLGAFSSLRRFAEDVPGLADSTTVGANVAWQRQITSLTSANLTTTLSRFTADNPTETESLTASTSIGLSHHLTPRLSVGGSIGLSVIDTTRNEMDAFGTMTRGSELSFGHVNSLQASYQMDETSLSLSYSRGIRPSDEGELRNTDQIGLTASHSINRRNSLDLRAAASRQTGIEDGDSAAYYSVQITPRYTYRFAADWNASVGYGFRFADDSGGTGFSNQVFLQLSRNLTIIP